MQLGVDIWSIPVSNHCVPAREKPAVPSRENNREKMRSGVSVHQGNGGNGPWHMRPSLPWPEMLGIVCRIETGCLVPVTIRSEASMTCKVARGPLKSAFLLFCCGTSLMYAKQKAHTKAPSLTKSR